MVAIDEDWSAVRFRRLEFIKQMKRPAQYRFTDAAKRTAGPAGFSPAREGGDRHSAKK
jgi:hypothetical protein